MSTQADQIIDVLRAEHDVLATFVADLDTDGVTHPSAASEWTVAQVLSHLGSGAEITLAGLNTALAGHDDRGPDFNQSVWDRWNAKSPTEQATDFIAANAALVERYEGIDAATRESVRIDMGFLPEPVDLAFAASLRLNEFALHAWDVLVAFDPATTLPISAAEVLIDRASVLFGWIGHAEALNGARGTLAVHTTAPERSFGVDVGDSLTLIDLPSDPGATLSAPAEAWLRLISGRLAPEYTPATVIVSGELLDLEDLRRAFPGF